MIEESFDDVSIFPSSEEEKNPFAFVILTVQVSTAFEQQLHRGNWIGFRPRVRQVSQRDASGLNQGESPGACRVMEVQARARFARDWPESANLACTLVTHARDRCRKSVKLAR